MGARIGPLIALGAALIAAAPAQASTLGIAGGTIVFTDDPGASTRIQVAMGPSDLYLESVQPVAAQAPCAYDAEEERYDCPTAGVTSARFDFGDGNDILATNIGGASALPWVIDGGTGDDQLRGGDGPNQMAGGDGNDQLFGGDQDDLMGGGAGDDTLDGQGGSDRISGGPGIDNVSAGAGDDQVDMRDGEVESGTVTCEDGNDTVLADRNDRIAESGPATAPSKDDTCEHLPGMPLPTPDYVYTVGKTGRDRIVRVDIKGTEAFPATYKVTLLRHGRTVGHATAHEHGYATRVKVRLARSYAKGVRSPFVPVKIRIAAADTAGRTGTFTYRRSVWRKR